MGGSIVSTRELGATTASVVSAGQVHWEPSFPLQDLLRGEEIELDQRRRAVFGHNWLAVKTDRDVVLVDPTDWRAGDRFGTLEIGEAQPLDAGLCRLGIAPTDVTHVVVTHCHIDHVLGLVGMGGGPRFPSATYHLPAADWSDPVLNSGSVRSRLAQIEDAGQLALTRGDVEICAHVRVLSAPGETDGHQVVEVADRDGTSYYLGDLVHFAFEFSDPDWVIVAGSKPADVAASRRRICAHIAERGADVIFTHAPATTWARLQRESRGWRYVPVAYAMGTAR